jgi:phosphoribosylformylglycinamidine synthase
MPQNPLARYRALHGAMRAGLAQACHDCSEGGLAVALAEMALAGRLGVDVDLALTPAAEELDTAALLFGESNGRLVVEVAPNDAAAFDAALAAIPCAQIGTVSASGRVRIRRAATLLLDLPVDDVVQAWTKPA